MLFNFQVASLCIFILYVIVAVVCVVVSLCVSNKPTNVLGKNNDQQAKSKPHGRNNEGQSYNPNNPYNLPGGNSDPPNEYWYAKPYGSCTFVPGTNCPKDQVFAGIAKDDCPDGDAKTLCAPEYWLNFTTEKLWQQFPCSISKFPCPNIMGVTGVTAQSLECPLNIDSAGKTVISGTLPVCTA